MANGGTVPVNWWESGTIRAALLTYMPSVLLAIKQIFKIDMTGQLDLIVTMVMMGLSLVGVIMSIVKRIQAGKDPANPAPKIQTPGVVQTIQRLTK